ncbi:MAG: MCE family protein [Armatimonadetes bacterium]|nr:MCE family protein [Armatimonadota bacterium]
MQNASRVGILVVLFAALLLGAYAVLQRSVFSPKTVRYFADFADAGGVTVGSKVLLAGVQVGQVAEVKLVSGTTARMTLQVQDGVQIPQGSVAVLPTALIGIGDRQVELTPPTKAQAGFIAPESILKGEQRSPLQAFAPDSGKTVDALNNTLNASTKLLQSMEKVVSDESLKRDLQTLLQSSNQTAQNFGQLAQRFDQTLAQNQAALHGIVKNTQSVTRDLTEMSSTFAKYVKSGKLEGQMDTLVSDLSGALDQGTGLVSDLRALVNNPQMQGDLKGILANTRTMTETGTEIAVNTNKLIEKGLEVGENVNQLMIKANNLADQAGELFDEVKKKLLGVGASTGGVMGGLKETQLSADLFRETDPNRWRTEVNLTIPAGKDKKIHFGLWDAFESNKLNAQLGHTVGRSQLRYGVYASKPGVGADYELSKNWSVRGDIFGVNNPRFDFHTKLQMNKNLYGWLGIERIFDRNAPSIGIGFRP